MLPNGKLFAWIEDVPDGAVQACFVGAPAELSSRAACRRAPASMTCLSHDDARRWVEREAQAFGCPVDWVETRVVGEMRA